MTRNASHAPVLATLTIVSLAVTAPAFSDIPAGSWARFGVADIGAEPRISELRISVAAGDDVDGVTWPRIQMELRSDDRRLLRVAFLASSTDFLGGGDAPEVARYTYYPESGAALEYVDAVTGDAVLPALGLFENLMPRTSAPATDGFPDSGELLGRTITRLETGTGVEAWTETAVQLMLDPHVLVGTSRDFRDDGTGRHVDAEGESDYTYVELTGDDYDEMIEAGFNLFRVGVRDLPHVIEAPAFFVQRSPAAAFDLLYRSNYLGAVMYMDEPAARNMESLQRIADPAAVAAEITRRTAETYEGSSVYGRRFFSEIAAQNGYDFGPLTPDDYPVWEAHAGAAWYELEAGPKGYCHQSRFEPAVFAEQAASHLGVDFPADAHAVTKFHLGVFRGAAEWFGARWGVSIYGQTSDDVANGLFPAAYDAGARYFWFWTSDGDFHVPYDRQLELARALRRHASLHPRDPGGSDVRERAAIVLPWGVSLDAFTVKGSPDSWLDAETTNGTTCREALREALERAAELTADGREYDVLFLRDGESPAGYDDVVQVGVDRDRRAMHTAWTAVTASPNPARRGTKLRFQVTQAAPVSVRIYNVAGRLVRTIHDHRTWAGEREIDWDATSDGRTRVTAGVYLVAVESGGAEIATTKLVVMR